jgi:hypothetical protein
MELLVAKLGLLLEAQTDKIAGMLFLIVALSYGSLFLLSGYGSADSSLVGVVAFFFNHWGRDCHNGGFFSEDNDGGRQEKGTLMPQRNPTWVFRSAAKRAEKCSIREGS